MKKQLTKSVVNIAISTRKLRNIDLVLESDYKKYFLFIALNVPLGLLLYRNSELAAVHEMIVLFVGIWSALFLTKYDLLLWCVAYIVGAEFLWRMTDASLLIADEFGKYSTILLLSLSLSRRSKITFPPFVVIYFLCLLPSTILIFFKPDSIFVFRQLRGLFGTQLCFIVFMIYFHNTKLTARQVFTIFLVLISSTVATAVISAYNIFLLGDAIFFGRSSTSFVSMGGGANQLSNAFALCALGCWLLISTMRLKLFYQIILIAIFFAVTWLMMLTFSRGGVFLLILCILATLPFILKHRNPQRQETILILIFGLLFVIYFLWPTLATFTNNAAVERYQNVQTSRWDLMSAEFNVWLENPLMGTGPGFARFEVADELGYVLQTHVEFTRYISEHGIFGLAALLIVFYLAYRNYSRARDWRSKIFVIALLIFTFGYWGQCATRTIAPSFAFGLTCAGLFREKTQSL